MAGCRQQSGNVLRMGVRGNMEWPGRFRRVLPPRLYMPVSWLRTGQVANMLRAYEPGTDLHHSKLAAAS